MDHPAEIQIDMANGVYDDYYTEEEEDDFQVDEYDIIAIPNDFNVLTIYNFIESGAIIIPNFQRNYVWDIQRASKLIESLILGLPVPQIFLYEEGKNKFKVIDGQQRLMSIYYFMKERFPRKEKRSELRNIFDANGRMPDEILGDDEYFRKFKLTFKGTPDARPNRFHGLNYSTLGDLKVQFDLRPIRNVIVKQNKPKGNQASIYEIFSRLNSGGMNLTPQEIRISLYHSKFYETLDKINMLPGWRRFLGTSEPDLHKKDVEILLRCFAILIDGKKYASSMLKFMNNFSVKSDKFKPSFIAFLEVLFKYFLHVCEDLSDSAFQNINRRFNIALFEAVFTVVCERNLRKAEGEFAFPKLNDEIIKRLKKDEEFSNASKEGTTSKANVEKRLLKAREIVG